MVVGTLTLEVGGQSEVVNVTAGASLIQAASGERSFRIDATAVEALPIVNRNFTSLAALAPGVDGNGTGVTRVGGGGDSNIMMDGVSTMEHGQQPAHAPTERGVDRRSESAHRRAIRPSSAGRAACRSRRSPRAARTGFAGRCTTSNAIRIGTRNSRTNNLNGDPKTVLKERDWGFSIGGPIGKPGGSNKLFFFYTHEFSRAPPATTSCATACRRRSNGRATSRSPPTTTAIRIRTSRIRNLPGTCSSVEPAGCFQMAASSGRIPPSGCIRPA